MFINKHTNSTHISRRNRRNDVRNKNNELVILKFGGALVSHDDLMYLNAEQAWRMKQETGRNVIIVHGGGIQIDAALHNIGIPVRRRADTNERVTDSKTLHICDQTLGRVNDKMVEIFNRAGCKIGGDRARAIGVAGYHKGLIMGKHTSDDHTDFTGLVVHAKAHAISPYLAQGIIPIVNPMGLNHDFGLTERRLNMNADDVALALGIALGAEQIIFCSNVPGVLCEKGNVIDTLSNDGANALISSRVIRGGMIPKVHAAMRAAAHLYGGSTIVDGRKDNAIYDALTRAEGGTRFIHAETGCLPAQP